MGYVATSLGQRVINLVKAVRELASIMPGDMLALPGEKPATYLGAIEIGDFQGDYYQMHVFRLWDDFEIVLEVPSLNRVLGKYLY